MMNIKDNDVVMMDIDECDSKVKRDLDPISQLCQEFKSHPFMLNVYDQQFVAHWPMSMETQELQLNQVRAVKYLLYKFTHPEKGICGGLLWMPVGSGKTYTIISAFNLIRQPHDNAIMFVMPLPLLYNFRCELYKRLDPMTKSCILHNSYLSPDKFQMSLLHDVPIVIVPYSTLTRYYQAYFKPNHKLHGIARRFYDYTWSSICFDESHLIGNCKTQRWEACSSLKSIRKVCMTGTAIVNRIHDIFGQLKVCGYDGCNDPSKWSKELFEESKLQQFIYKCVSDEVELRRTLPNVYEYTVYVRPNPYEDFVKSHLRHRIKKKQYVKVKSKWKTCASVRKRQNLMKPKKLESKKLESTNPKQVISHDKKLSSVYCVLAALRQNAIAPCLINPVTKLNVVSRDLPKVLKGGLLPNSDMERLLIQRDSVATDYSSKMILLKQLVGKILTEKPQDKILIYSDFGSAVKLTQTVLQRHYGQAFCVSIHSKTYNKQNIMDIFEHDSQCKVMCGTSIILHGFNLIHANHVIELHPTYTYSKHIQAIGRIRRLLQTQDCHVYTLVSKGTFEERMLEIRNNKQLSEKWLQGKTNFVNKSHMNYISINV